MTKLYLVRHGRTLWNDEMRYQGSSDIPLSKEGKNQARLLFERFKNIHIDKIYSSPLSRSIQTVELISEYKNIKIKTDKRLQEIDFGEWEGKKESDLKRLYGKDYQNFCEDPYKYKAPGERLIEDVQVRVVECVDEIISKNAGKDILISSHGGSLRLLIMKYLKIEDARMFNRINMDNTSISVLNIENGIVYLDKINDNLHLSF